VRANLASIGQDTAKTAGFNGDFPGCLALLGDFDRMEHSGQQCSDSIALAGTCPTCGSSFLVRDVLRESSPFGSAAAIAGGASLPGITGTTPVFAPLYRSYSTGTDGATDTTHTCRYGLLRVARKLATAG
jgi:hypothetical protein